MIEVPVGTFVWPRLCRSKLHSIFTRKLVPASERYNCRFLHLGLLLFGELEGSFAPRRKLIVKGSNIIEHLVCPVEREKGRGVAGTPHPSRKVHFAVAPCLLPKLMLLLAFFLFGFRIIIRTEEAQPGRMVVAAPGGH